MSQDKKWYKTRGFLLCVLVAAIILTVIIVREQSGKRQIKVIFISKTADESGFWSTVIGGANMAAREYDLSFTVLAPREEDDYPGQNNLIDDAIKRKPDVIVLAPCDYKRNLEAARKIKESRIGLVLIDSVLGGDVADAVITTDNVKAGESVGKYAAGLNEMVGKIGLVSHVKGSSTAADRTRGVRKGLGDLSLQIESVVYCDSKYDQAYQVTKEMLTAHPSINLIISLNEYATVGAARVVKDMGLSKKVRIIGFDNSKEEIQLLESGVIQGLMVQKPFDMGYLGIRTAVDIAQGRSVSKKMDSGYKMITSDMLYTEENQKLLFPFWSED